MSLDVRHQLVVMDLLRKAARNGGGVLAVIHDLSLAARFADRVLIMDNGRIAAQGTPAQTLDPARIAEVFGVEAQMLPFDGVQHSGRAQAALTATRSAAARTTTECDCASVITSDSASCRPMVTARSSFTRCATSATAPTVDRVARQTACATAAS